MIAVVIPYFQREPGVLRRALASVAAQQRDGRAVHVLIVDDASPAPAAPEIDAVALPAGMRIDLIRQPNGGPGAARNSGLAALPPGVTYVAFLDSDDEWSPDHLVRAAAALDAGFDFYFADHFQLGQSVSAFERAGRIRPGDHEGIAGEEGLHAFRGDFFNQILTGNVVGTSTVVYRRAGFESVRFRTEFRSMGEDYLFWLELATLRARTAFSARVEATYGRGVNVFAGSGWGTPGYLRRVHDSMRFHQTVRRLFSLSAEQDAHARGALRALREEFVIGLLHHVAHRQAMPEGVLAAQLRLDPSTLLAVPAVMLKKIVGR